MLKLKTMLPPESHGQSRRFFCCWRLGRVMFASNVVEVSLNTGFRDAS